MKVKVKIEKEVEITTLEIKAEVRYWEDATVNGIEDTDGDLIPCRIGENWCPIIDINSGIVTNWKQGVVAEIHYKVCDAGSYYLKDEAGNVVLSIEEDYVPDTLAINDDGYGDYIIMDIFENGQIGGWDFNTNDFQKNND